MTPCTLFVEGVGFWAPTLPGWQEARAVLRQEGAPLLKPATVPRPMGLPHAERRRAPETVALALHVAEAATKASARQPKELLAVFTSALGDQPAIDYLCDTLAKTPLLVSPTRFLHTIHNAPLGVWSMLHGNSGHHTAVSAAENSFATGLLEAAMLVETENCPVLLVGYDTAATGALVHTNPNPNAMSMAIALVLSPFATPHTMAQISWHLEQTDHPGPRADFGPAPIGMHQALPLLEALAHAQPAGLSMRLSRYQQLQLALRPLTPL